jgi:hypothetical protein
MTPEEEEKKRKKKLRDSWTTPDIVWVKALKLAQVEIFDLDPCANPHSIKKYVRKSISLPNDGLLYLQQQVDLGHVYINCPYSKPLPWVKSGVETLLEQRASSLTFCLPLGRGAKWDKILWGCSALIQPIGRVHFHAPPGIKPTQPPGGTSLYHVTQDSVKPRGKDLIQELWDLHPEPIWKPNS